MLSSEPELTGEERDLLSRVAWRSVAGAAQREAPQAVHAREHTGRLSRLGRPGASFVTLRLEGALRGCIGSLEAIRPLIADVAHNARAAALEDPRFSPLEPGEVALLKVHLSVLGPLDAIGVETREELLTELRPRVDGLVLRQGSHRATFLPGVWDALPEPDTFVRELERKAGFKADAWSQGVQALRYAVWEWHA